MSAAPWQPLGAVAPEALLDARLEAHYAVQTIAAAGESWLAHTADTGHTNLAWRPEAAAWVGRPIPSAGGAMVAVAPEGLRLQVLGSGGATLASFSLAGRTLSGAMTWLADTFAGLGEPRPLVQPHYEMPEHRIANGGAFRGDDAAALGELARWFANGTSALEALAAGRAEAVAVRCWPHHFDVGLLFDEGDGRSVGVGLSPGDEGIAEPYFYVNHYPAAVDPASALPELDGAGVWHTEGWLGGVLNGAVLTREAEAAKQRAQVERFLASAVAANRALLG